MVCLSVPVCWRYLKKSLSPPSPPYLFPIRTWVTLKPRKNGGKFVPKCAFLRIFDAIMKYFRAKMDGGTRLKTFLNNGIDVILVIMDVVQLTVTVFATAAVNICVIVWLYSKWIIPEIVRRVRDDMMTSIQTWIENTRDDLNNSITINIDSMKEKIVQTIRGYRGNKARQLSLAKEFLEGSDYDPDNPETEENESIITDAIARYGASIVKAALKSMTTKQATAEESAGVW